MSAPIKLDPCDMSIEPYLRKRPGGKVDNLSLEQLVEKINALPESGEKEVVKLWWRHATSANAENNAHAIEGWVNAVWLAVHATGFLLPNATKMVETTKRVRRINKAGTAATKAAAASRMARLTEAVTGYLEQHPKARGKGPDHVFKNMPKDEAGKVFGYAESTAKRYIQKLLQ